MPNERVIVVGAGAISDSWFPPLKAEGVQIAAVVDLKPDAALAKIDKYQLTGTRASADLDQTLRDVPADFLLDLTIPDAHCQVTCKALRAGLPVLGEKPLAATMDQARQMLQTSEQTGKLYMVSQSRRWDPLHDSIARTIAAGSIGTLHTINCDFFLGPHFGGFRDAMDSPLLLDMAIHQFDLARLFSQQNALSVYAEEFNPAGSWYQGAASANCLFEMTNHVHFAYRGSWCAQGCRTSWAGQWRFIGSTGTLLFPDEPPLRIEAVTGSEGFFRPVAPVAPVPSPLQFSNMHGSLREMLAFLRTGQKPQTECHDNIHTLAMTLAAVQSARTHHPIRLADL